MLHDCVICICIDALKPAMSALPFIQPRHMSEGETIDQYVKYFSEIVSLNELDDGKAASLFKVCLAANSAHREEIESLSNWSEIQTALVELTKPCRSTMLLELDQIHYRPGTSVQDTQQQITRLVNQIYESFTKEQRDTLVRDFFLLALPNPMRRSVMQSTKCKSIKEMVTAAETFEATHHDSDAKNVPKCTHCGRLGHLVRQCRHRQEAHKKESNATSVNINVASTGMVEGSTNKTTVTSTGPKKVDSSKGKTRKLVRETRK